MIENQPNKELEEAYRKWAGDSAFRATVFAFTAFCDGWDSRDQSAQVALAHERQRYAELADKVREFLDATNRRPWTIGETLSNFRQAVEGGQGQLTHERQRYEEPKE